MHTYKEYGYNGCIPLFIRETVEYVNFTYTTLIFAYGTSLN